MTKQKANIFRVTLTNLPPRDERTTDNKLDQILKRIAGKEGSPCERTCDCTFGLVCMDGVCSQER